MLFFLRETLSARFEVSSISEAIVSRVEADTRAILYFFFKDGEKTPFLVVKASSDRRHNDELKTEYANLLDVFTNLPESMRDTVPRTEGSGDWRGLYYYAHRYIPGDMLCETIDDRPDRSGGRDPAHGIKLAWEWLLRFQDATKKGFRGVGDFNFTDLVETYKRAYSPGAEETCFLDNMAAALGEQEGKEIGLVTSHGDFFPGNIIISGERVKVIDWRFLRHSYHPFFDFFTLLATFYTSKGGITDYEDYEGHFGELFFERHWTNEFFAGLCTEYVRRNNVDKPLFFLLLEFTLLEWSTREYATTGETGKLDEIWRRRFVFYMKNKDRIIFRDPD